jgi:hypothetical protein
MPPIPAPRLPRAAGDADGAGLFRQQQLFQWRQVLWPGHEVGRQIGDVVQQAERTLLPLCCQDRERRPFADGRHLGGRAAEQPSQ